MNAIAAAAALVVAQVDLLELARSGRVEALAEQSQLLLQSPGCTAITALELACAWLLAGDGAQADLAIVEADLREPSLALVPDPWGLWPAPQPDSAQASDPGRQRALALAEQVRQWRDPNPQQLWRQLLPQLQANWKLASEPGVGDALLILGRATAQPGSAPLDPPLEPELVQLVADAEIAAEPAASNRYWQRLATIRPHWGLARVRAADLALARGELETSARWLADPPAETLANPWFHDVAARHAVASGRIETALESWQQAITAAQANAEIASLVEIFEQRRREARRGPGVLQVRSLANRGEQQAALALLERLLADDPRWQPLCSLKEQLQPQAPTPSEACPSEIIPSDALERFSRLLDRAGSRLSALGQPIPEPRPIESPANPEAALAALEAQSQRLSALEARFALA